MPALYSIATTVPLDANGNPTGNNAPTMEEILVTSALLHLFLGSRFLVEDDGRVKKVLVGETLPLSLTDTVNFHPKDSYTQLLRLATFSTLRETAPDIADEEEKKFCLCGVCVISGRELFFCFQSSQLKVRIS